MNEIWRKIEGFENYEVSNLGNVRSLKNKKVKILKLIKRETGYIFINLYKNKKIHHKSVHRLVASTFIPNPQNKSQVNHIDGDKTNNKVENLEWCTAKENSQHAWNTGLSKSLKGEKNPMYGKHHTKETKNKISESLKGEKNSFYGKHHTEQRKLRKMRRGKSVVAENIKTGEILEFPSQYALANYFMDLYFIEI